MPNVIVPKSLLDKSMPLPKICIACGKPATNETIIKTNLESPGYKPLANDESALGLIFSILHTFSLVRKVAERESRSKLHVPVCRYHRWIVPPGVTIESENADTVQLSGVSPEFIALVPKSTD